ncbi:hypothetical protein VOI54_09035 [Tamlana sp. 2201CG12-4]|uniref:hypothetical protein n=1 Tax=Tamlana sp. 2201CG12-4 TaxID=3112582 RepID=UPI002DBDD718|nr:hypothetical protein [Tamlana sp. 2201CG12-4]MEC3907164.1 hypothetical protein [Tamlana sp. 2201CG12-4]
MKRFLLILIIISAGFVIGSCTEDAYERNNPSLSDFNAPMGLKYTDVINGREFGRIRSVAPTLNTGGILPFFEIVSIKDADGNILDDSYTGFVEIFNKDEERPNDERHLGRIIIGTDNRTTPEKEEKNIFATGDYFFTIKVTISAGGETRSETFEDVFRLNVAPLLAENLLYVPIAQNLIVGSEPDTSKPSLRGANPAVSFELGSDTDKLTINPDTGVISLKPEYSTTENDTIYPLVRVISKISEEVLEFQGKGFLWLVASNTPVTLPRSTNYFFYPSLKSENKVDGYLKEILVDDGRTDSRKWVSVRNNASFISPFAFNRPDNIKPIITGIQTQGKGGAIECDAIFNTVDLTLHEDFDVSAEFHYRNEFTEYFADGSSPVFLEMYYSVDFDPTRPLGEANAEATWVLVNDIVECTVPRRNQGPFIGMPYPGDQRLKTNDVAAALKDPGRNGDSAWVVCVLDLNTLKSTAKKFTMKAKYRATYTGSLVAPGRDGRYKFSDIHYRATEK